LLSRIPIYKYGVDRVGVWDKFTNQGVVTFVEIYKAYQSPFQSPCPLTLAIMPSLVLETNVKVADL
jgi:hypothetical protein